MKTPQIGAFLFTLLLGGFVLACLIAGRGLPPNLQIATNIAGYSTLFLIILLLAGQFIPGLLRWAETTLQDVWGGQGTDARSVGRGADEDAQAEGPVPWPAVARSMGYALGFLALAFVFGFYLVPPVFIATYLILDARVPPLWAIASGVVATVVLIGGMQAVNVDVWVGVIPEIIPGYLGGSLMPPV